MELIWGQVCLQEAPSPLWGLGWWGLRCICWIPSAKDVRLSSWDMAEEALLTCMNWMPAISASMGSGEPLYASKEGLQLTRVKMNISPLAWDSCWFCSWSALCFTQRIWGLYLAISQETPLGSPALLRPFFSVHYIHKQILVMEGGMTMLWSKSEIFWFYKEWSEAYCVCGWSSKDGE